MDGGSEEATILGRVNFVKDTATRLLNVVHNMEPNSIQPTAEEVGKVVPVAGIEEISIVLDSSIKYLTEALRFLEDVIRPKLGV